MKAFDDLRCPNAKCVKSHKGGEGSLVIVPGTETDPVLKCRACGDQNHWKYVLRSNLNVGGTSLAGGLFSTALLAVQDAPIPVIGRVLFGVGALGAVGSTVWTWARYAGRVVDTKIALKKQQDAPLGTGPLPHDWQVARAAFVRDLAAVPIAKQSLWPDLLALDSRISDAYTRLNSLRTMTSPEAEAKIKAELEERSNSQKNSKSTRAKELQEEALVLMKQRLEDLPKLKLREEEINASLQTATTFLESLRGKLAMLRDVNASQIEEETKLMALDLKGRLAEIESLLE